MGIGRIGAIALALGLAPAGCTAAVFVRSDSNANMVTGSGSVGFSGSVSPSHYTYDNFSRIDLGNN